MFFYDKNINMLFEIEYLKNRKTMRVKEKKSSQVPELKGNHYYNVILTVKVWGLEVHNPFLFWEFKQSILWFYSIMLWGAHIKMATINGDDN